MSCDVIAIIELTAFKHMVEICKWLKLITKTRKIYKKKLYFFKAPMLWNNSVALLNHSSLILTILIDFFHINEFNMGYIDIYYVSN